MMRIRYSTTDSSQQEIDAMPRIQFRLQRSGQSLDVIGLVDSGATVNVLPYDIGLQLGAVWKESEAHIRLAGNLSSQPAMGLTAMAEISDFAPVRLAFAWVRTPNAPLILGQTNFLMEFDVCFYRSRLEFEVTPSS